MQEMTSKDIPNTDERFGNGHGESGWKWNKIDGVEAVGMGGKTAGNNICNFRNLVYVRGHLYIT